MLICTATHNAVLSTNAFNLLYLFEQCTVFLNLESNFQCNALYSEVELNVLELKGGVHGRGVAPCNLIS